MSTTDTYPPASDTAIDVDAVRRDFPILSSLVNGKPLVYLDNAATSQKPQSVITAISDYYTLTNSNVHRGVHTLSQRATDAYEAARDAVRRFVGAEKSDEIIFTKGTTDSINLVAGTLVPEFLTAGDEILVTEVEHHSNIVPWQLHAKRVGATVVAVPVSEDGIVTADAVAKCMTDRTRLVAVTHVSNTLGTINDVGAITKLVHEAGAAVLVDGAQAIPHLQINVSELDCDFYCFSAHKMFGPTGIGVLFGKEAWLDRLPPYQGGGGMIDRVRFSGTTFGNLPFKFEAGTPDMAGAVGLHAAIDYMERVGRQNIEDYEAQLTTYTRERLSSLGYVRILGADAPKAGVFSFLLGDAHPFDTGSLLDQLGIAVRTGHHCNQPLMDRMGVPGTVRASLAFYNTRSDIDRLAEGLDRIRGMLT